MVRNIHTLRKKLESRADELEFELFGVAEAQSLSPEARRLREWLDLDYQGNMHWMERNFQRRTDPGEVVPGARSVIMLGYNYYTGRAPEDDSTAKISNYAWGDDYHEVVTPKVRELESYLSDLVEGEMRSRSYVDTGPVLEKAWAARAGLGWIGKHTNLINREYGSWFFLGSIITDVELEYDSPVPDYCGSCTRCIEACPTDAIVDAYVLDARRCLSYLTIENKSDDIPDEHSENMHGWIYGCDICQNVCPWNNKFEQPAEKPEFQPREENVNRGLGEWLDLREEEYRDRFKDSPIKRAKRRGILRNVKAALGE